MNKEISNPIDSSSPSLSTDSPALAYQLDFIKLEFQTNSEVIARIDGITQSFKNWCILIWTGSISIVLAAPDLRGLLWFTVIVPALFWFLDAWWKRIQRSFMFRIAVISDFLNSDDFLESFKRQRIVGFKLLDPRAKAHSRQKEYRKFCSLRKTASFRTVSVFYAGLALVSMVLAFLTSI